MKTNILLSLAVATLQNVYVNASFDLINYADGNTFEAQVWTRDSSINSILGLKSVTYCKVEDPTSLIIFESFGSCRIEIPRVLDAHHGVWRVLIGYPEKIALQEHSFTVSVVAASTKPTVTTNIVTAKPMVTLTCALPAKTEVIACKFRDPTGKIFVTTKNAVTDDRYAVLANTDANSCDLQITNPITSDLGLWRCGVETEENTYYGFLTVLCPWAMMDPAVAAAVVTDPVLSAQTTAVSAILGDEATLLCSVPASIRYCFFRSRNGTIFNVGTEQFSRNAQYYGSGLDAGECGIRFPAQLSDAGIWSCHVGFADPEMEEQRVSIQFEVNDLMVAEQYTSGNTLVIESKVHNSRALDYCRFVRIDGLGFTSTNPLPDRYSSFTSLAAGHCAIHILDPTILDHHPWTVVAMIKGLDKEVSRVTYHSIDTPGSHENPDEDLGGLKPGYMQIPASCFWLGFSIFIIFFFTTTVLVIPKSRKWILKKSASARTSIRREKLEKPPLPVYDDLPERNIALPA